MEIGDKGYLIEVGMKGFRDDKWLKPPLYELIEIQKGFNVTHYVFRSVEGGYKRTMMDKDFNLGEWAFCDTPEPISRSEQPRLKARIGNISKHSYMTKFNKGGGVRVMTDWYVWFLLIVALIIFALTEYAVRRDRREWHEWKEKNNLPW